MIKSKFLLSIYLLVFVMLYGSIGYYFIEGWPIFDAMYMTVITVSTIGFQETHNLSDLGRIFTLSLVFFGLGVMAFCVNNGVRTIFEGELKEVYGRRKMERALKALNNHYIVCGYGRMGKVICNELKAKGLNVVAVEHEDVAIEESDDTLIVIGDATKDEFLKKCGIERAHGLITVLASDAQNLYVVLSAKELNPDLKIVSRASDDEAEPKLLRAGADKVVSPYQMGGLRIANSVLKPAVVDFLELANKAGGVDIELEEINVQEGSFLARKTVQDAKLKMDVNVILIAIKKYDDQMIFHPDGITLIEPGDKLIAIGKLQSFTEFEKLTTVKRA